jgi:preprotein translocase subunit SecG
MESVILTIHLLIAAALIIVVLLQRSEGGGLGIGGGGGGVMSGRSAATALSKLTWVLGIAFVATSLTLTIIAARQDGAGSVLDRLGVDAPATETAPGLDGGDLLPPPGTLAPAVPPSGELAPAVPPAGDGPAAPPPVE